MVTTTGMPTRQFSATILAGSWPMTDPLSCDALARTHHLRAQELFDCADQARGAADKVVAAQSGSTIEAFHQTSYRMAATFTDHADQYSAMGRASAECGAVLSGLRDDLDHIDHQAHQQIDQLMKSATTGPAAIAARTRAIQIIAQARADATNASTAAAAKIADQATTAGIEPTSDTEAQPPVSGLPAPSGDTPTIQAASFKKDTPAPAPAPPPTSGDPTMVVPPRPNPPPGVINLGDGPPDHLPLEKCKLHDDAANLGVAAGGAGAIGAGIGDFFSGRPGRAFEEIVGGLAALIPALNAETDCAE